MKKLFYVLVTMLLLSVNVNAQLKFVGNKLIYGSMSNTFPTTNYNVAMKGNQFYWVGQNSDNAWIRIAFDNSGSVAIGGSGGLVRFHGPNSLSGVNIGNTSYNNICVSNIYWESDSQAKTNILSLNNSTSKILQMRPVSYEFTNREVCKGRKVNRDIGFLAQELQTILPEAVMTTDDGDMLVNYTAVIPLLTNAIQELNARIE